MGGAELMWQWGGRGKSELTPSTHSTLLLGCLSVEAGKPDTVFPRLPLSWGSRCDLGAAHQMASWTEKAEARGGGDSCWLFLC